MTTIHPTYYEFTSKKSKRLNELALMEIEVDNIVKWVNLAKAELSKENQPDFNFDLVRAYNIAAITTYAKFFSSNKGFSLKPKVKNIFNEKECVQHHEIYNLRNQIFAHIDDTDKLSMTCEIYVDHSDGLPTFLKPNITFAAALGSEKLDTFILMLAKLQQYLKKQYEICGNQVFEEFIAEFRAM